MMKKLMRFLVVLTVLVSCSKSHETSFVTCLLTQITTHDTVKGVITEEMYTYDNHHRLSTYQLLSNDNLVISSNYTFDVNGRMDEIFTGAFRDQLRYDDGILSTETITSPNSQIYYVVTYTRSGKNVKTISGVSGNPPDFDIAYTFSNDNLIDQLQNFYDSENNKISDQHYVYSDFDSGINPDYVLSLSLPTVVKGSKNNPRHAIVTRNEYEQGAITQTSSDTLAFEYVYNNSKAVISKITHATSGAAQPSVAYTYTNCN